MRPSQSWIRGQYESRRPEHPHRFQLDLPEALHHARPASGLYTASGSVLERATAHDDADLEAAGPELVPALAGEELRLDVDGRYPQMTASGTIPISPVERLHWIATLHATGSNTYTGGIWLKDPAVTPFGLHDGRHQDVERASRTQGEGRVQRAGLKPRTRIFKFVSPTSHKVEVEYDSESPIVPVVQIDTCAHPNHPATLPCENLTIRQVFQRSGFDTSISPNASAVGGAPGGTWSDMEMHDAMIVYWSRFANLPQWALWTFFADQHETGTGLGGIMFDDIGPNHRQGTALFYNSFISDPPPIGDPNPSPPTLPGTVSGPRCTRWATRSTSRTRGRSRSVPRSARRGFRSWTSRKRAAS